LATIDKEDLTEVVSRDRHCFGCSQQNPYGLQMRFFTDDTALYSWLDVPAHLCGWNGIVHGGVLSTILDEIMCWAGIHQMRKVLMTRNMKVEYLKPVYIGEKLRAEARIIEKVSAREAIVEGLLYREEDDALCSRSRGSFAIFSAAALERLQIVPPEALECFGEFLD